MRIWVPQRSGEHEATRERLSMTNLSDNVYVEDATFGVFDAEELPVESGSWANGLVRSMSIGAWIATGISMGNVRVAVTTGASQPETIDPGPWDEIVDVSVYSKHGDLRVSSLEYGPVPALPLLSSQGPGTYRLRVHARGRDSRRDHVQNDPTEDYLLVSWPAEAAPEVIIRLTDFTGYSLRLSESRVSPRPSPPPEPGTQRQREQRLHQALLDKKARLSPNGE